MKRRRSGAEFAGVRLAVFDFDGVFTDNRVLVFDDGREAVYCTRADGLGLERLAAAGFDILVLSTETNGVVGARCRKLGLRCIQGCREKLSILKKEIRRLSVKLPQVCYLGNDVNDLACLEAVGWPVCVADAWPEAKRAARVILKKKGGQGAVRELCDRLLAAGTKGRS